MNFVVSPEDNDVYIKDESTKGDMNALLKELENGIEQEGIQNGFIPSTLQEDSKNEENIIIQETTIPNHLEKWTELRNFVLCKMTNSCKDSLSNEAMIQKYIQSLDYWTTLLAKASEMTSSVDKMFETTFHQLINAKSKSDISKIQASTCAKDFQEAFKYYEKKLRFQEDFWELGRKNDIQMLKTSQKTIALLNQKFEDEQKKIINMMENNKKGKDVEFKAREKVLIAKLTELQKICTKILKGYEVFLQNMGPPLKTSAIETVQALKAIQHVSVTTPPIESNVIGQVTILQKAIGDVQLQISNMKVSEIGDPDDKPPQFHIKETLQKLNDIKQNVEANEAELTELKHQQGEMVKMELALYIKPHEQAAMNEDFQTQKKQMAHEIENAEKFIQNLKRERDNMQLEYDTKVLEEKKYLAQKVNKGHPVWVEILSKLFTFSSKLNRSLKEFHEDRQRVYDQILEDYRLDMKKLANRKQEDILNAIMMLQSELIKKRNDQYQNWQITDQNLRREIGKYLFEGNQLLETLALTDSNLAQIADELKKTYLRSTVEKDRLQSLKEYIYTLQEIKPFI